MANRSENKAIFPRFLLVGGIGFLIDAAVFLFLVTSNTSPITARIVSASCAITLTWYLNRRVAFKTRHNRAAPEYARYVFVQIAGLSINFLVFIVVLKYGDFAAKHAIVALCAGAISALTFNYIGAKRFAYRV